MNANIDRRNLDATSVVGILTGFGLLVPAIFVPELRMLAVPASMVLLPSLLIGMR